MFETAFEKEQSLKLQFTFEDLLTKETHEKFQNKRKKEFIRSPSEKSQVSIYI